MINMQLPIRQPLNECQKTGFSVQHTERVKVQRDHIAINIVKWQLVI